MDSKNIKYLILSIVLLILSGLGIFFILKLNNSSVDKVNFSSEITKINNTPTSIPTAVNTTTITPTIKITPTLTATPTAKTTLNPSPTPKTIVVSTPTIKITPTLTATPTAKVVPTTVVVPTTIPVSSFLNFKNTNDGFSINYSSNRKLYQDIESTGNRYTFYSALGNFAVHVSSSGTWSWTNSDRNFTAALIVSGQNTYRYDISTQTIVDLQSSSKNYTIQCVHNGKTSLKDECEEFIRSFTLL